METVKFKLDTKSGVPFYRQIIQQVEYKMSIGKLEPGDKLPTVRSLAVDLKVNPNTVAKAYNELELTGLVNTHVGSGTFVADKQVHMSEIEKQARFDTLCADFLTRAAELGLGKEEILKMLKNYDYEE
jgi:GntR family transcriptional regulator